ncbi:MAG: hypothetical protein JST11_19375 [Acidobacteria bacterium]|nr:hypothetical protein [Acidobacteriota bacterium]
MSLGYALGLTKTEIFMVEINEIFMPLIWRLVAGLEPPMISCKSVSELLNSDLLR